MSKAIKRAIVDHKEKKARRDFEKDSKYIVDDIDRISSAFQQYGIFGRHCNGPAEDSTEDDASSVSSFSTTATTDDNPGAGYTIDKYFYQPVGRRIEKIAFRIAMPLLSPFRIFQYIEEHHYMGWLEYVASPFPLYPFGLKTVYLAGLECLVHQTRSNSLIRSSAALSALIRLCPTADDIACFFYLVHNQIGHPNLALSSIDNDTQEKKCYLFLITLIWARPDLSGDRLRHGYNNYTGIYLKKMLLKLVNSWRVPNKDAFAIMSEASLLFAQAIYRDTEDFEPEYFFAIFIVRFIPFIYNNSTRHTCGQQTKQLCHMLLLTFLRWLDSTLSLFAYNLHLVMERGSTPHMLQTKLTIDSLLLHDPVFATLLPVSTGLLPSVTGPPQEALPKNRQHRGEHLTITDTFIRASIARTQRLLTSLDELEREIRDSMSRPIPKGSQMSYDKYRYTLSQARSVNVFRSEATEEFSRARRGEYWDGWIDYKQQCYARHEWGIYLCSNYDWDRDTTQCLKRLFECPEEAIAPPAPIATVSLDGGKADTWNISTDATMPMQIKVAYKSTTGETEYMTFMRSPSTAESSEVAEVQDEALAISPEPRNKGGKEAEGEPRITTDENNNAAPRLEAASKIGVKQVVEKPHKRSVISGGIEEFAEGLLGTTDEGNDAPRSPELGARNSEDDDGFRNEDGSEKTIQNVEQIREKQVNQISICSLD